MENFQEKYQEIYPYATDLILWFIEGKKEDNYLYQIFGKQYAFELSELALSYEYNYTDGMEDIENEVRNIIGINNY